MNRNFNIIALLSIFLLAGCGDLKKGLGFEKDVPDEFLIKKNNPIVRPPNYDLLPPDSKNNEVKKLNEKNSNSSDDLKIILKNSIDKKENIKNLKKSESESSSGESEDLFLKKIISK